MPPRDGSPQLYVDQSTRKHSPHASPWAGCETEPLLRGEAAIDFSSCSWGSSQEENYFLLSSSAGACLAKGLIFAYKLCQFSLSCIIKDMQPPIV